MAKLAPGLVQIYTGNSKGKTTAALGLVVRAIGRGLKVYVIQFMKGQGNYGEIFGLQRFQPDCQVESFGGKGWVHKGGAQAEDLQEARLAFSRAQELIASGEWDIVILDEIINAIWFELLPEEEVLNLCQAKPDHVELVLTGRNASERLIGAADLVTEMRPIKHPYEKGIPARLGIEF